MTVYAMRTGTSPNPTIEAAIGDSDNNVNYNCPTNPLFIDTATLTDNDRMFTYVSTTPHTETFVQIGTAGTQYSNLSNTKGYNIKCYDNISGTGIRLNALVTTHDHYVLIHSDNALIHHMAKITQIRNSDVDGDSFDFSPRLGKQIPKDSKFMVFKGANINTTSIVAVSAGIRTTEMTVNSTTYRMNKTLICSKPLFYFYNDRLDKKNELDHNTKYFIKYDSDALADVTVDGFITNCFITTQDFNLRLIDYSKFSMKANLIDNLRLLDDPKVAVVSNEGLSVPTTDFTDYDDCFYNIRRDSNDLVNPISDLVLTGPYRYVNYKYSPAKANHAPNLVDVNVFESIGGRGGYAEARIVDVLRIMPVKIKEFDAFRVRHQLHRGHFNEFFALKATIKSFVSGLTWIFSTEYDLIPLLASGDEVLVGDKIVTIVSIAAFDSAALTQQVEFGAWHRLETATVFAQSYVLQTGDRLSRRAWSQSKSTLLTSFPIMENRNTNVKIVLINTNYEMLEATVTGSSVAYKTLTLSFDNVGYATTSALDHITGDYLLEIERFEGEVEQIDMEKDLGQNFIKLYGRDNYSKLLGPVINKSTLSSQDIIYSSNSPHNTLASLSNNSTFTLADITITNFGAFYASVGDKIFIKYTNGIIAYVGEVEALGAVVIQLKAKPLAAGTGLLYRATDKHYMFNKALSSNSRLTNFPTSLSASAEKGLFFESGIDISDDSSLVSTSLLPLNPKAIGYHIDYPKSVKKEEASQALLTNGIGTSATFDTVNTLMDFTVLDVNSADDKTTIEIAPYIPLTLGRLDYNDADTYDITLTSIGTTSSVARTIHTNNRYINMDFSIALGSLSLNAGDAIYVAGEFVGYFTQRVKNGVNTNPITYQGWKLYLDRSVVYEASATISTATNSNHNLYFTNGEHLHGGKYVSLLHPTFANDLPTFFNATSNQDIPSTVEKYGLPLYKLNHIEKGNYNYSPNKVTKYYTGDDINILNYYTEPSAISYHASAYKTNHGNSGVITARTTETSHEHLAIENRGYEPASGSLYFDYNIFESGHTKDSIFIGADPTSNGFYNFSPHSIKDVLGQYDGSSARLFLFATSDLMPYSSNRTDSLFNSNRDLTKFNLFLLNETSDDSFNTKQSQYIGTGKPKKYLDSSYQSASIVEVDAPDLTKLKRMSLMRLTEVVYDCAFNQFNPEKPPKPTKTLPYLVYYTYDFTDTGETLTGYATNSITLSSAVPYINKQKFAIVEDGNYRLLARATTAGTTAIIPTDTPNTNKLGTIVTNSAVWTLTEKSFEIRGHADINSFAKFNFNINLLKGLVHTDSYSHADVTALFCQTFNLDGAVESWAESSLVWPLSFVNMTLYPTNGHTSTLLKNIFASPSAQNATPDTAGNAASVVFADSIHGVFLDRFSVEGGKLKTTKGTTFPPIVNTHRRDYTCVGSYNITTVNSKLAQTYANYETIRANGTRTKTTNDADGVIMGFKVRVYIPNSLTTATETSPINKIVNVGVDGMATYTYIIKSTDAPYLDYIKDLTGTYLVSEWGKEYNSLTDYGVASGTSPTGDGINNTWIHGVSYVMSHEIDTSDTIKKHIITVDYELTDDRYVRVMQPNETAFYEFSPATIKLGTLSSEYTKMAYTDEMYSTTQDYLVELDGGSGGRNLGAVGSTTTALRNHGSNEGVLSMYVVVDIDRPSAGAAKYIVKRNMEESNAIWGIDAEKPTTLHENICVTDGNVVNKTNISFFMNTIEDTSQNYYAVEMTLGKMREMKGIISISETMTITTNTNITGSPKRALIGSVVSICSEADDIVNDLFEENDIEFTQQYDDNYPLFIAPNFKGVDLFSSVNYIIEQKNKSLSFEDSKFKLVDNRNANNFSNLIITDRDNKYHIKDFSKSAVLFDFYNEVIVYGLSHQASKTDIRSIKKRGLKTLEYDDINLHTLTDVITKANELLKLHSTLNQKVTLEIGHKGISQLRAGDIITLEFLQENLQINQYQILQMRHLIDGFIRMELGRYSKGLDDRFAEILAEGKKTRALGRKTKSFNASKGFLDISKIKELQVLIRTRVSSGGSAFNIGFSTPIGFGIAAGFGVVGASVVEGTVLEIDL